MSLSLRPTSDTNCGSLDNAGDTARAVCADEDHAKMGKRLDIGSMYKLVDRPIRSMSMVSNPLLIIQN